MEAVRGSCKQFGRPIHGFFGRNSGNYIKDFFFLRKTKQPKIIDSFAVVYGKNQRTCTAGEIFSISVFPTANPPTVYSDCSDTSIPTEEMGYDNDTSDKVTLSLLSVQLAKTSTHRS